MSGFSKNTLTWLIFLVSMTCVLEWRFFHHHGATLGLKPTTPTTTPLPTTPSHVYMGTDGKPFPYHAIRLNKHVVPVHYDLEMTTDLEQFLFWGQVKIEVKVNEPIHFVVLHIKALDIKEPFVIDNQGKRINLKNWVQCIEKEQLFIEFDNDLEMHNTYTILMVFNGRLTDSLRGFYRSSYEKQTHKKTYLALTQFEPTDARMAFPCFDEPNMKATFSMKMTRSRDMTATLFNTRLLSSEGAKDNSSMVTDTFEKTVKMSTYLVAWVVSDFANISATTPSGKLVSVYTPPHLIKYANFSLESGVKVLESYEKYFGVPYPLSKQDLVAIPDFSAGAMENWGLITFRMSNIVYDPLTSSQVSRENIASAIAHEMTHQWFGDLVTMDWWSDLWLNEGFASFLSLHGSYVIDKAWKSNENFVSRLSSALYEDSMLSSHPISVEVRDPAEISSIFDSISYSKGASILHMLREFIGEDVLRAGLKNYLLKYKYRNTVTNDLWDALTETMNSMVEKDSRIDVKKVMNTWTNQMGYPVVTVTMDTDGKVHASQQRFVLYRGNTIHVKYHSKYNYKWHIPLTVKTNKPETDAKNIHWMHMKDVEFDISKGSDWLKANVDTNGYYRVQYSNDNWKALSLALLTNHNVFTTTDRVGLIDDSFSLARAGLLDISIPFELCEYLVNEKEHLVWAVVFDKLDYIRQQMELDPSFHSLVDYYMDIMKKRLLENNWASTKNILEGYLRTYILNEAILLEDKLTVKQATVIFDKFMQQGESVNPEVSGMVYRAGIVSGQAAEWSFLWSVFLNSTDSKQKSTILSALGKTRDSLLIQNYLENSLDENLVHRQFFRRVMLSVSGTASGRVIAWQFFKQHYDVIFERHGRGQFEMADIIGGVCSHFTTTYYLNDVKRFFSGRDAGSGKNSIAYCIENISMNIAWHKKQKHDLISYFNDTP